MSEQQRSTRSRLVRRVAGAATAVALTAGLGVGGAPGAQAASAFTVKLSPHIPLNPGLVLDVSGGSQDPYAGVIDWVPNGGLNQVWTFYPFGGNEYEIVNANSNQCLTTDGTPGHQVFQYPCDGRPGQHWVTNLAGVDSTPRLIQNPWSTLFLDVYGASAWGGTEIDAWWWNGGDNQYFYGLSAY